MMDHGFFLPCDAGNHALIGTILNHVPHSRLHVVCKAITDGISNSVMWVRELMLLLLQAMCAVADSFDGH